MATTPRVHTATREPFGRELHPRTPSYNLRSFDREHFIAFHSIFLFNIGHPL